MENNTPIKLVIAALGGQGGGVLTGWIARLARNLGWPCQTTSVPGVAQRTGATIYYIEMFPTPRDQLPAEPVLSLFPTRGDVDVVIAAEIVEAGRMIERGFVTPNRTHLIASSHRVYAVSERINQGDATIAVDELQSVAADQSKQLTLFDMQQVADKYQTLISASLFGALSGAGVLPFDKLAFRSILTGEANFLAFDEAFEIAQIPTVEFFQPNTQQAPFVLPKATSANGHILIKRINTLPFAVQETVYLGVKKLNDYLDNKYAASFLTQIEMVVQSDDGAYTLTNEFARLLALWSSHEDIIRVAHLKVKKARLYTLKQEVGARDDQILHVRDFFKPRVEEICGLLPTKIGRFCLQSAIIKRLLSLFTSGKQLATTNIGIFLSLRAIAGLRRFRRGTLAFVTEEAKRLVWINAVKANLDNQPKALAITRLATIVKGYGATRERGYDQIEQALQLVGKLDAEDIHKLQLAALQDDEGHQFFEQLVTLPQT